MRSRLDRGSLLFHRVLKDQRLPNNLLTGLDAGNDFLYFAWQHITGDDLYALKPSALNRYVDPIPIVQM